MPGVRKRGVVGPPLQSKKMRLSPSKAHGSPGGGGNGGRQKPRVSKKSVFGSPLPAMPYTKDGPGMALATELPFPAIGEGLQLPVPRGLKQQQQTMGNTNNNANAASPPMNGGGATAPDSPTEGASPQRAAYVNHTPGSWCPESPYGPQVCHHHRHTFVDRSPTAAEPQACTRAKSLSWSTVTAARRPRFFPGGKHGPHVPGH